MAMELCCSSTTFSLNLSLQTNKKFNSLSFRTSLPFTNKPSSCTPLSFPTHKTPTTVTTAAATNTNAAFTISPQSAKTDKLPAPLDVQEFEEPNSKVRLSVSVPSAVCEDCYREVMRDIVKNAKLPGFRPGKNIPESIVFKLAGKANIQKATVESILRRTLPHAMISLDGRALEDTIQIITEFSHMLETYTSQNSLRYDVLVDVLPEVKWSPEDGYKNLNIVVEIDNEITAEVACEREITRRHKRIGPLRIVADRGLQVGDVVVVDVSAATFDQGGGDGQNIPSAESKGFQFDTDDKDFVLPGFVDAIIGIRPGETKSFPLVFPESWRQEDLRGVQAQFTVECKELFYRDLPPLDDSVAENLIPGCSTLAEVKEALLQRCRELEQTAKDQATDNAILDRIRKMAQMDIPESLLEEEGRQMYGTKLLEMQARKKLTDEQLASLTSQKAVKEYIEHEKENLIEMVKQNLAVADIFVRENLQVATEEVVKQVANSIDELKKHNQEYDKARVERQVEDVLAGAKVLEWLREQAEIQYITPEQQQ